MKSKRTLNSGKVIGAKTTLEEQLTPQEKEIWANVKQGFEELKLNEEGKLNFRPIEQLINELSDDEEDAYLLAAMDEVKNEPIASAEEAEEFEKWLKSEKHP